MMQGLHVTRWLLAIVLAFYQSIGFSTPLLVWPDYPNGRLYRIDVQKKTLEAETAPNVWQALGTVQMKNVAIDAFPPATRVTCLTTDKGRFRYFLVDCTQQVYRFDNQTRTLERLDKTFFRGYNCYSAKFLRQDTLYSFGGYGFWHTNNILSYYKTINHEWESVNPIANAPRSIYQGFNGYLPENDSFFSALSLYQNDSESKGAFTWNDSVYTYSFKKKTWELLGQLTTAFRQYVPSDFIEKTSYFQAGRYFVFKYYASPQAIFLIVDPIRNETRIWKDTHKLLANLSDNYENNIQSSYVWHNTLYFRRYVTGATEKTIQVIRFPIADLWRTSTVIGAFYEPVRPNDYRWLYGLLIAFLILSIGTAFRLRKSGKPKPDSISTIPIYVNTPYPNSLNNKERDVFEALLKANPDNLTADHLNEILLIGDKGFENQRKIRSEVIKGLNLKLKLEWGINEAVERIPTTLDQRMYTYALKQDVLNRVQASQNNHK